MQDERLTLRGFSLEASLEAICKGDDYARSKFTNMIYWGMFTELLTVKKINDHQKLIEKKRKFAFEYLSKETKAGNQYATAVLGWMYKKGFGTKASIKKAAELYETSANASNPFGFKGMGDIYLNPEEGVPKVKDEKKAIEYYLEGAKLGNASCLYALGEIFEKGGDLTPKDICKAEDYYRQAAQKGSPDAISKLNDTYDVHTSYSSFNPYLYYLPKNVNFKCDVFFQGHTSVSGNYLHVSTHEVIRGATIKIVFPQGSDIPEFCFEKKIRCVDFTSFVDDLASYGFNPKIDWAKKGMFRDVGETRSLAKHAFWVIFSKEFADVIEEADSRYNNHVAQEKSKPRAIIPAAQTLPQQAPGNIGYPGAFYPPQQHMMQQPIQMDQQQMFAMMQMMQQQNAQLSAQMLAMQQQFQQQTLAPQQPQHGIPPQYQGSGNNNNGALPPSSSTYRGLGK